MSVCDSYLLLSTLIRTRLILSCRFVFVVVQMEIFRACWKKHNNDERTSTKDT